MLLGRIIGAAILLAVFGAGFSATAHITNTVMAVKIWLAALTMTAVIVVGVVLLVGDY